MNESKKEAVSKGQPLFVYIFYLYESFCSVVLSLGDDAAKV